MQKVKSAKYGTVFVADINESQIESINDNGKDMSVSRVLTSTSPSIVGLMVERPRRRPEFCELCSRRLKLTRHHLLPKSKTRGAKKKPKRKGEKRKKEPLAYLCGPCHEKVHSVFTEKELHDTWNTVEKLLAHDEIRLFVHWIHDKPIEKLPSKTSKKKGNRK